jgi:hypothetical protein
MGGTEKMQVPSGTMTYSVLNSESLCSTVIQSQHKGISYNNSVALVRERTIPNERPHPAITKRYIFILF